MPTIEPINLVEITLPCGAHVKKVSEPESDVKVLFSDNEGTVFAEIRPSVAGYHPPTLTVTGKKPVLFTDVEGCDKTIETMATMIDYGCDMISYGGVWGINTKLSNDSMVLSECLGAAATLWDKKRNNPQAKLYS